MKYFTTCTTLDELKSEYRRLALENHPDVGGSEEAMKAINSAYDEIFPVLKLAYNRTASEPTHETAESTRSEFYTANGWKGRNYDRDLSTKDISEKIRAYLKASYTDCRFSVTTHYASMCSEISVALMSGPYEALRSGDHRDVNYYRIQDDDTLTDWARAVLVDVNDCITSYHWDDSDAMIDYFDVNFYYNLEVGRWDKPYTVKMRQPKITAPKEEPKSSSGIRVQINDEFDGIEVYFGARPEQNVRDGLKANGWRWHSVKKCWYNRNTEKNLQSLRSLTEQPA